MRSLSPFARELLGLASVEALALFHLLQVMERGPVPWLSIARTGVATAIVAGPFVWVLRDRYSDQQRARLALVAFGITMIAAPITLGLALAFGVPAFIPSLQGFIVGVFVGCLLVFIAEHTMVPERLRPTQ